jgi:hypothetical protein
MNADRQLPWPRVRLRDVGLDQRRCCGESDTRRTFMPSPPDHHVLRQSCLRSSPSIFQRSSSARSPGQRSRHHDALARVNAMQPRRRMEWRRIDRPVAAGVLRARSPGNCGPPRVSPASGIDSAGPARPATCWRLSAAGSPRGSEPPISSPPRLSSPPRASLAASFGRAPSLAPRGPAEDCFLIRPPPPSEVLLEYCGKLAGRTSPVGATFEAYLARASKPSADLR